MNNYPDNIKDAIDWVTEADLEGVKAQAAYNDAVEREYQNIRKKQLEEDKYGLSMLTTDANVEASQACIELRDKSDALKVEVNRRIRWFNYLLSLHEGTAKNE